MAPPPPTLSPSPRDPRPAVAMVCNANTPYRLALHLRIAHELPEFRLISVFTHEVSNSPWKLPAPPEIGAVSFGEGESAGDAPTNHRGEWRKARKVIDFLEREGVRAVVLHGYNDTGRIRILRWCRRAGVPCFLWGDSNARSDEAKGLKRAVKSLLISYLLRQTAGVMVCGTLGKEFFVGYGADPSKVYFVPYEPDYDLIRTLPDATVREAASRFDLGPGRRRLVYSGRLVGQKRVDLLIQAFNQVADERPEWDLVIVGDGHLKPELQALVRTEVKHRVKWLGFQTDQAIVSAVYRNADALCLPSSHEPWALVINEATAAGLAVLSSDVVGASAELVRDGVNGKLFRSGDLQNCTDALRDVTDPAKIDRYRAASVGVLADWRQRGDPVKGLRTALEAVGVVGSGSSGAVLSPVS